MAEPPKISRRGFLSKAGTTAVGGSALLAVGGTGTLLSACGQPATEATAPEIVALFSPDRILAAGLSQRIPFAIVAPANDSEFVFPDDDAAVEVQLTKDGEVIEETEIRGHVVDHDHVGDNDTDHQHADLFRYYPARLTLPEPGIYDLVVTFAGGSGFSRRPSSTLPVQAFDPDEVTVPLPGQPMPIVNTPTFDDPAGVDRICTRFEPCPFHEVDFATAIQQAKPAALLVATPAYCATAYCGPVVDTLIAAADSAPNVTIVHAEVYANTDEVGGNLADPAIRLAPAVEAIGLSFEPSLFLVNSSGTLVDRIDNVFDITEAEAALAALR